MRLVVVEELARASHADVILVTSLFPILTDMSETTLRTLHQEQPQFILLFCNAPFFVNEFLRVLYRENLLIFDAEHLSWQWNIDQIQAQDITYNTNFLNICYR